MAKPPFIELGRGRSAERIPILYEDRSVIAVDKPKGWMLVPFNWQKTNWNLQAAILSSIGAGAYWARSRSIRFLRYVHRLDAETSGILLFGRSLGAVERLGNLFETRRMEKRYLAVVQGRPQSTDWVCRLSIARDPARIGRMRACPPRDVGIEDGGKECETMFRVLETRGDRTLVEASPLTGRTHQIRVHLASAGLPIVGDELYGELSRAPLALRAVELRYQDPFTNLPVTITAPTREFLREHGFDP